MTNHLLAAAQHARAAAQHAAAGGDRATYWMLLSITETLVGDPELGETFADLALRYETGSLTPPAQKLA